MKFLAGLLATISSLFAGNSSPELQPPPPLNTAIVAYQQTYFAPAVAEPGNFPWAKKALIEAEKPATKPKPTPVITSPPSPILSPAPAPITPPPAMPAQVENPYLALIEPATLWLRMDFTLAGDGFETPQPREFSINKIDREYWKIEVFAYWAVGVTPPKPPVEENYFKLEIYEKVTNKLVYTMTSGKDESFHKFQTFKKPGEYYFKIYTKPIMKYEINLFVSSKMAQ